MINNVYVEGTSGGENLKASVSKRESLEDFRRRAREVREREWRREAIRARRFTGEETFQQGLDLIKFAIQVYEAGERAGDG